jgi:uncharacterized protein
MSRLDYLSLTNTIDGLERRVPILTLEGTRPGPTLWLTANIHGDEVTGIEVIHRVLEIFQNRTLHSGTLHAIPTTNPMAFEMSQRHMPYDNDDLNRHFPGDAKGTASERVAALLYNRIISTAPDLVLDLHTITAQSIPFVIVDRLIARKSRVLEQRLYELSNVLGLTVVYDFPQPQYEQERFDRSLSGALVNHSGIAALTVELGARGYVAGAMLDAGVACVFNAMLYLRMLPPSDNELWKHPSKIVAPFVLQRANSVRANRAGIVQHLVKTGDNVRTGQVVARIKSAVGEPLENIHAPSDGFVLALSDYAVAFPGSSLMTLAVADSEGL